jgi:hypothetical protein
MLIDLSQVSVCRASRHCYLNTSRESRTLARCSQATLQSIPSVVPYSPAHELQSRYPVSPYACSSLSASKSAAQNRDLLHGTVRRCRHEIRFGPVNPKRFKGWSPIVIILVELQTSPCPTYKSRYIASITPDSVTVPGDCRGWCSIVCFQRSSAPCAVALCAIRPE